MEPFVESDMTFGPFPDGHCFRIEQSRTYQAVQDGVRMAEFILLRMHENGLPHVWIVEAKSSSPRPENEPNFADFIGEIRDKLVNALTLGVASILNRHPIAAAELPELFRNLNLTTACFRLVLIINGHQKPWLSPLQDALRSELRATSMTWGLGANAVAVINHEDARRFGLISAP